MRARASGVSLLLAAAGATCLGPRRAPVVAQAPSPCRTLSARGTIRRVQTSKAFLDALDAIARARHVPGVDSLHLRGGNEVSMFCRTMDTVASPSISPKVLVFFPFLYEPDYIPVKFGVSAESVSFLSGVDEHGALSTGLNLKAWNAFVHSPPALELLSDPAQALSYSCLVWSVASDHYPDNVCNWVTTLQVVRSDSGSYTVTDPQYKRRIRVRKDREVLEVPDF